MNTNLARIYYGGKDPRQVPAYSFAEASRYLRLPRSTLVSWVKGRNYLYNNMLSYLEPIITPEDSASPFLSFDLLIEAHILKALRKIHRVSMRNLRAALNTAQNKFQISNLLLSPHLKAGAGELFLDRYGELINLSKSGQYAMKQILIAHLERVEYDSDKLPFRFYPFLSEHIDKKKIILIDPLISFGKPVLANKNISTAVIVSRIDAGEAVEEVAHDYDLNHQDIEDAILYERAA